MTYYGGKELAAAFRTVRKNTMQVAQDLPGEQYGYSPAEGTRTVSQLLVHVAVALRLFWHGGHAAPPTDVTTFDFFGTLKTLSSEEATPRSKPEIIDLLTREGEAFTSFLETMSEDDLSQMVISPSPSGPVVKSRFEMLSERRSTKCIIADNSCSSSASLASCRTSHDGSTRRRRRWPRRRREPDQS
jgi:uncharacterized damage-inducible protein DinB